MDDVSSDSGTLSPSSRGARQKKSKGLSSAVAKHMSGASEAASRARQSQKRKMTRPTTAKSAHKQTADEERREAELKKAKSVQSARDCRKRKKEFIRSLQLQVKQCEEREAATQKVIATLEQTLIDLKKRKETAESPTGKITSSKRLLSEYDHLAASDTSLFHETKVEHPESTALPHGLSLSRHISSILG